MPVEGVDTDRWPLIIAGPIVRRAQPDGVAVWIALRAARRVTAHVYDAGDGRLVAEGITHTKPCGARFHPVVVHAAGTLEWGRLYTYELWFDADTEDGIPRGDLFAPGVMTTADDARADALHRLTYLHVDPRAPALPSFAMPPESLDSLRLLHGSCRLPHGESADAMEAVDIMIGETAADPLRRPHQFFLTGDQVYVNNIAPEIMPAIMALSDTLLGWAEILPGVDAPTTDYPRGTRDELLRSRGGLLAYGDGSHLVGLGEIYALYLLGWSEVPWPDEWEMSPRGRNMRRFLQTMAASRRALANVPTYMIFDDHEVTDDWNLTLHWCRSVMGTDLGRRMVINALAAYTVFQAWGNVPAKFEDGTGRRILELLCDRGPSSSDTELGRLVGLPPIEDVNARVPPCLEPADDAMRWHYRVEGPNYEVVVLDQRTRRAFPGSSEVDRPALMSESAMREQIREGGTFDKPLTIVVSSSAVLPIPKPWYIQTIQWIVSHVNAWRRRRDEHYADVYGPDRGDSWFGQSAAFERLIAMLASNSTPQGDTIRTRVVTLVGDIHIGSAARLQYWGRRPWVDDASTPAEMVMVQLTASPLRKEHAQTRLSHQFGYGLGGKPPSAAWAGFHERPHVQHAAAPPLGGRLWHPRAAGEPPTVEVSQPNTVLVSEPPDWLYRVDYLAADSAPTHGRKLVGVNNVGEIRFEWQRGDRAVIQTLWWRTDPDEAPAPLTTWRVSLELDDPNYPPPDVPVSKP